MEKLHNVAYKGLNFSIKYIFLPNLMSSWAKCIVRGKEYEVKWFQSNFEKTIIWKEAENLAELVKHVKETLKF